MGIPFIPLPLLRVKYCINCSKRMDWVSNNLRRLSPMVREIGVQSQVESYQRHKKWYWMPPRLALSAIRWGSRVNWSNLGNGVVPSPTPRCRSYWNGSLLGHPRLWSSTLHFYSFVNKFIYKSGIRKKNKKTLSVFSFYEINKKQWFS